MVQLCLLNHKNASNIQNFSPKMPQFGKKLPEKCILYVFFHIAQEILWPVWETGRFSLYPGNSRKIQQSCIDGVMQKNDESKSSAHFGTNKIFNNNY